MWNTLPTSREPCERPRPRLWAALIVAAANASFKLILKASCVVSKVKTKSERKDVKGRKWEKARKLIKREKR